MLLLVVENLRGGVRTRELLRRGGAWAAGSAAECCR
jgi:hypothetical protein